MVSSKLALGLAMAAGAMAKDLPAITMKGQKFFYENGTQFFMKGIAYQQDTAAAGGETTTGKYLDPLADAKRCKQDVPLLEEMGTNIIRTYAIDPEKDHSTCMKLLSDAGIYVISDLSEPKLSINRDDPKWNTEIYQRYTDVIDELAKYSNVVGFFAGNEVSNAKNNTEASAYVKAAVRDSKKYIKSKGYKNLGVGYAANDDKDIREEIADYFNCGSSDESIDFWGYNIYSWCGKSDMQKSGYDQQIKFFEDYSVPIFFAEYGCNNQPNGAEDRTFTDTRALYNDEMTKVFSGGIVYMYFQEANDYGLVELSKSGEPELMKNAKFLAKEHKAADPKGVDMDDYSPSLKAASCPKLSSTWRAGSNLPPTPDQDLCDCMVSDASCGVASGTSEKSYGDIFDFICSEKPALCKGIGGNATTGVYGAYHGCNDKAKVTYVLNEYYKDQDQASDACDFKGKAEVLSGSAKGSCKSSLEKAESHNKKVATASSFEDAPSETGSASTSDDDEEDFGVPSAALNSIFLAVAAIGAAAFAL